MFVWAEGVLLAWDSNMCGSPYHPPSSGAHLKSWDGIFLKNMGWRKIGKKRISHPCVLKHRISSHFRESFYWSNSFKLECHLSNFVPHFISSFMDNFLKFFQTYQGAKRMPETFLTCVHMVIRSHIKGCENTSLCGIFSSIIRWSEIKFKFFIHVDFFGFF